MTSTSVIILLADGLRPDTLRCAIDRGEAPALAMLRNEGALHTVVTAFPSVTGVAYAPFLVGRLPGPAGLPGLRWYDRQRRVRPLLGYSRSYVGFDIHALDSDLDAGSPTLFELTPGQSLGSLSLIDRGLGGRQRVGTTVGISARAAWIHGRGDPRGWLDLERRVAARVVDRIRRDRPRFAMAAFPGVDKISHAAGHDSPLVTKALHTVDDAVAAVRRDAEHDGRWRTMHLWIVSDHGHAPVHHHDDLATALRAAGLRVRAHPFTMLPADVAVMVSGNAMAHLYLEIEHRTRPFWPALRDRWSDFAADLGERPSVDLLIRAHDPDCVEVRARGRGSALITRHTAAPATTGRGVAQRRLGDARFSYHPVDGDPLDLGERDRECAEALLEASIDGDYPDAVVQIAELAGAARSGDIILSAAPRWDFRDWYEPISHRSTHGALHRDHMLVPLLLSRPPARRPRRTVDVMPSVLRVLGIDAPPGIDGTAFM